MLNVRACTCPKRDMKAELNKHPKLREGDSEVTLPQPKAGKKKLVVGNGGKDQPYYVMVSSMLCTMCNLAILSMLPAFRFMAARTTSCSRP